MSEAFNVALQKTHEAIGNTVLWFRRHPFDALYEADLRSYMYVQLLNAFDDERISLAQRVKDPVPGLDRLAQINSVKAEYPTGIRFDIALIDPYAVESCTLWNQPVHIAIELKLWQIDDTGNGIVGDLEKLWNYRQRERLDKDFCGISLLFVHPEYNFERHLGGRKLLFESCFSLRPGVSLHLVKPADQDPRVWDWDPDASRLVRDTSGAAE
jgi:hypothetical protein